MVTPAVLAIVDPNRFLAVGVGFRLLASRMAEQADRLTSVRRQLSLDWSGNAAWAALQRCEQVDRRLRDTSIAALRCDQVLCELAERVRRACALLRSGDDPHHRDDPTHSDNPALAIGLAREADRLARDQLHETALSLTQRAAVPRPPARQACAGWSPDRVATWWSSLAEEERRWLITRRPDLVGGLDGIPAADRDLANRSRLDAERDQLLAWQEMVAASDASRRRTAELDSIDARLRGIDAILARLGDASLPRAYLLDADPDRDGRAVVAMGNPDRATDVLTYVPGAGSGLPDVASLLRRADAVSATAVRVAPEQQLSAIAWLGYDAPDGLGAALARPAHDAEAELDRFADSLRMTHDSATHPAEAPSHNTVLAHSYGSLVAGVTARDRGLDADDLIFVGSPGVGVDHVRDLGRDGATVWSSTARDDPVQRFAPGLGQLAINALANTVSPLRAFYGDAEPDVLLWHGRNPATEAFGARIFASDADGGHSGYWQGEGLANITRIALGAPYDADVSHPAG